MRPSDMSRTLYVATRLAMRNMGRFPRRSPYRAMANELIQERITAIRYGRLIRRMTRMEGVLG